ncbi:MAG: glutaredoxin 3 [Hyphomicrobiales bacterium]|nr:glutaredoxin 3 [Hyphomicrobiales bacterium]
MKQVEIYTSPFCGYCHRAKALLTKRSIPFVEFDVVMEPQKRAEMEQRTGGARTVPQIFIDGQSIGGSDDLAALDRSGQLPQLLSATPGDPA